MRQALEAMFASQEWNKCSWAKKPEGKQVKKTISKDDSFWPGVDYALKTTGPLLKVLSLIYGEKAPSMGFIYEAMDRVKEEKASELGGEEAVYKEIWDIIDEKLDVPYHDLHVAAYYLNPQHHYEKGFQSTKKTKTGLYRCMDGLLPNEDYMKVDAQFKVLNSKQGLFGFRAAQLSCKTRFPGKYACVIV